MARSIDTRHYEVFLLCTETFKELMTNVQENLAAEEHGIKAFYAPTSIDWGGYQSAAIEEAITQSSHAVIIYSDIQDSCWTSIRESIVWRQMCTKLIKELPLRPPNVSEGDIIRTMPLSASRKFKEVTTETSPTTLAKNIAKAVRNEKQAPSSKLRGQADKRVVVLDDEPFCQDIYKGVFVRNQKKRLVAVRKALLNDKRMRNEIDILQESSKCDNLIGFIDAVTIDTVWHCCLQYCAYSVEQYVLEKALQDVIDEIDIVRGVANGLDYLHSRKKPITHINLAPAGVRIMVEEDRKAEAKICDISTSPRLYEHAMEGFINPSPYVDVFSFGCFAYYVITKGEHPFSKPGSGSSKRSEIQSRIDSGEHKPTFKALEDLVSKTMKLEVEEDELRRIGNPAAALALVKSTLDEGKKPSSCCITSHCYFFNPERQCHFHHDFGNCTPFYEGKRTGNMDMDPLLDELSEHEKEVFGSTKWGVRLLSFGAKIEIENDFQFKVAFKGKGGRDAAKKYDNSIQGFSYFLRDQFSHELNDEKKREFWESDDKKALMLNRGFPRLLPVCWDISKKMPNLSKYHCDEKH
ncbi:serine/threonine-protein kinase/endoribonuclease IRE1-like [Oscarella lobularis]|uniref:serine/threonine-protein kinase/endoribonuclease IRE1-like n=1 Tax=Oscarella lobularis TaxID=121494 RepID=UPI0033135D24